MAGTKAPPSHESLHHGEGTSVALRLEEGRGSVDARSLVAKPEDPKVYAYAYPNTVR